MNYKESEFNEHNSLALIESMINKAKNQFSENGHLYLLWGWVVFICSISHFVLLHMVHFERPYIVWSLTWLVVVYQSIYLWRKKRNSRVRTYTDEIIGYVWLAFVFTLFLMGFVIFRGAGDNGYKLLNPVFLAIYGIPTFLSGVILRLRALTIGGISCWLLCILSTFIPYDYQILLISLAMVVAWIIPGYLLRAKFKNAY